MVARPTVSVLLGNEGRELGEDVMRHNSHYYGLDVLRLVAASFVVLDHFGSYGWRSVAATVPADQLAFPFLTGMTNIGSVGVEIFFLLSGFVIAASAKGSTPLQFALSRAIRVFPALWLCGLVALVARATTGEPWGELANVFARSALLSPVGPYIDGVVWTLVVEAIFYLLVFVVLLRGGFGQIERVAKGLGMLSAAFITIMALAAACASLHPALATLAALCDRFPFKVLLLRHGVFFALGILLWAAFETRFSRTRVTWMLALTAFCTLELGINRGSAAETFITIALWWAGFAAVAASVAGSAAVSRRLGGWTRVAQDVGRLSYPLYLNHYSLGMVLVPALSAAGLGRTSAFGVSLGLVVGSSYLVMRYPERWIQKHLRARLRAQLKSSSTSREPMLPAGIA